MKFKNFCVQDKRRMEESFFKRVYQIVECVPRGKVASYGQIARMAKSPRAARQVGDAQVSCRGTGLSEPTAQLQAECVNRFAERCKKIYKN